MERVEKTKRHIAVPMFLLLATACGDLIIRDDGKVKLGLEECDGVSFQILVKQSGKPNTSKVVKVEDGELEFDVSSAGYDFDRQITVQIMAVGSGAEACGISGVLEFNGTAESTGIGDHKISLGDFKERS